MEHIAHELTRLSDADRYRILVESITDYAVYLLDKNGIITSWNPGAQRFKGYTAAEIIGHHFSRFYTAEDRKAGMPETALRTAARVGRYESEGWRVRKDGTRFWTHVIIDPVRTPNGDLIGFAKITRDLTERKAAEAAIRRSEEQFRRLVQSVTDYAIYMLDPMGFVASWNLGAERIKGYAAEEIIGQHFSSFYLPEDRTRGLPERGLRTAAEEGRWEHEGWRLRKDGSRFWAHAVIDCIRDEQGELVGFAKITRDVTERKNAQRVLDETREALFQAQKLEAIGQLTGGVAHDFNNLLMVIQSSLEMIRKRLPEDPKLRSLVDNATRATQRGAGLTQRMLAFARKQELNQKNVDIPDLVRSMKELLQRSLGPTIKIETRFPLNLEQVHADPNQLESALLNLAVNARDAMPGGGLITIEARQEDLDEQNAMKLPAQRYVCFSVQDRGHGMDAETLARATEPFFTTKGVGKGTGLGLPMAQGFAEQSGGRLVVKSKPRVGTTVEIWLPALTASSAEPGEDGAGFSEEPQEITRAAKLTILAVDDDPLVLMNTVAMLEDLGHTAFEAPSGATALDVLREKGDAIDLVITDQAMPGMTGLDLIKEIASAWPNMPIVLATGYADLPGFDRWDVVRLAKPFFEHDLAAAIDSSLDRVSSKESGRVVAMSRR